MSEIQLSQVADKVDYLTSENTRTQVLMEEVRSQNEVILEYVKDIPEIKSRLTTVEEKVDGLTVEMRLVKGVIRQHSADIAELKVSAHRH